MRSDFLTEEMRSLNSKLEYRNAKRTQITKGAKSNPHSEL